MFINYRDTTNNKELNFNSFKIDFFAILVISIINLIILFIIKIFKEYATLYTLNRFLNLLRIIINFYLLYFHL